MQYTEAQRRAIETRDKNILVAAAAGSGKTRVLVDRIIQQILDGSCDIEKMLVVTFTNAAATEMRERIEKELARELERELQAGHGRSRAGHIERQMVMLTGASICTFHAFCQQIIRAHIESLDIDPQFRLAGDQEIALMKQDVLEDLFERAYREPEDEASRPDWNAFLDFVDAYGNDKGDKAVYDAVLKLYHFSQSQPFPKAWLQAQEAQYTWRENGSIWENKWANIVADEALSMLDSCIAAYSECHIVRTGDDAALETAWQPYREWIEEQIAMVESVQDTLKQGQKERTEGSWDAVCEALQHAKISALSGKKYKALQEDFKPLRDAFDERREAAKKILYTANEKYFTEEENEIRSRLRLCGATVRTYTHLVASFIDAFQAAKKEQNVLDFNDLEHFALELLCANPDKMQGLLAKGNAYETTEELCSEVAQELRDKYAVIMVDEYQDTNRVQETILDLIARERNRFTVGDVKQSIYRFRLADPQLFQLKYEAYPEDLDEVQDNQLITMRENFRSRADVLMPINFIFEQIMHRDAAELEYDDKSRLHAGLVYPPCESSLAGPVEVDILLRGDAAQKDADDESPAVKDEVGEESGEELAGFSLEAQHIATRINTMMKAGLTVYDKNIGAEGGYRPLELRDIAVLLRAVKGKGGELLRVLRENGISAYADADGGYFEATEVRLMMALLAILDNARQDIPLAAILVSPIGGFTMEELARLRLCVEGGDLYDALLASFAADSTLEKGLAARVASFQEQLAAWRTYTANHSVPELIWKLYRETGYYDYVGSLRGGILRQANLRMLADRAADYEKTNYRGLFRFLRFMDNLKKRETDLSTARALGMGENVVRVMSIHKSKGLEFPVVILADMGKSFNMKDAGHTFLMHKTLGIAPKLVEETESGRQIYATLSWQAVAAKIAAETKAEEMRILYVAMTRAREKLILVGSLPAKSWEKRAAKWCRSAGREEKALPAAEVRQAISYLDWIMPALARHADGEPLRLAAGISTWHDCGVLEPDAHFAFDLVDASVLGTAEQGSEADDALLAAVREGRPLPSSPAREMVEARLNFHYDIHGLADVPAKLTVTEIKHRFVELSDVGEAIPSVPLVAEEQAPTWKRPHFLQESAGLSVTERGTLMHAVMQHLDFGGDLQFAGIRQQIAQMERRGIIPIGSENLIYMKGIHDFANSALGVRMRRAKRVMRELPFSRMVQAKQFFPQVEGDEEMVFVQGVIDVLFEEADGTLVLLDYKTDREADAEKLHHRYAIQIALYARAVEEMLGRSISERYLYSLRHGTFIPIFS